VLLGRQLTVLLLCSTDPPQFLELGQMIALHFSVFGWIFNLLPCFFLKIF
jgi:hypothetical protein